METTTTTLDCESLELPMSVSPKSGRPDNLHKSSSSFMAPKSLITCWLNARTCRWRRESGDGNCESGRELELCREISTTPADEVFIELYSQRCKLALSFLLGVLAMYLQSSASMREKLLGPDNDTHAFIWWLCYVPMYVGIGLYFFRYFGAFLARVWIRDVCRSKVVQRSAVTFAAGILEDERLPGLLNATLSQGGLVAGAANLATGVARAPGLHRAVGHAIRQIASEAAADFVKTAEADEVDLENRAVEDALAGHLAALFSRHRPEIAGAVAGLMQDVLQEPALVKQVDEKVRNTVAGTVADPALYQGIRKGIGQAVPRPESFFCSAPPRTISEGAFDLAASSV